MEHIEIGSEEDTDNISQTNIEDAVQAFLKQHQKEGSKIQCYVTEVKFQNDIWQVIVNVKGPKSGSLNTAEQEQANNVMISLETELKNQFSNFSFTVDSSREPIEKKPNKDHLIKRI